MQDDRHTDDIDTSGFTTVGTVEELTAGSSNRASDTGAGMYGPTITGDVLYDSLPPR